MTHVQWLEKIYHLIHILGNTWCLLSCCLIILVLLRNSSALAWSSYYNISHQYLTMLSRYYWTNYHLLALIPLESWFFLSICLVMLKYFLRTAGKVIDFIHKSWFFILLFIILYYIILYYYRVVYMTCIYNIRKLQYGVQKKVMQVICFSLTCFL